MYGEDRSVRSLFLAIGFIVSTRKTDLIEEIPGEIGSSQRSNVSPPRQRSQPRENIPSPRERSNRAFDPNNIGRTLYDSLRIFELGYDAEWIHVKRQHIVDLPGCTTLINSATIPLSQA